jgi:aspartate/methionine/tyrosine aminotransferase
LKGLSSLEFALKLLYEKRCAVAPGSAFNTTEFNFNIKSNVNTVDLSSEKKQIKSVLNSFCRVSLASSLTNVEEGIHLICDLLDEIDLEQK